jgi:hypothetical protein
MYRCSNARDVVVAMITLGAHGVYQEPLGRMVLSLFGSPPPDSKRYLCRHIDGDPANNRIENLEWVKFQFNPYGCGDKDNTTKEC